MPYDRHPQTPERSKTAKAFEFRDHTHITLPMQLGIITVGEGKTEAFFKLYVYDSLPPVEIFLGISILSAPKKP